MSDLDRRFIGYGLMKDGEPCGMWPQSYEWQDESRKRMLNINGNQHCKFEIVPVYIGAPVRPVVLPGINGAGGSA